jgi:hypothetical protein
MIHCSACGQKMKAGYVIFGDVKYYWSDYCLKTEMTMEEYLLLY